MKNQKEQICSLWRDADTIQVFFSSKSVKSTTMSKTKEKEDIRKEEEKEGEGLEKPQPVRKSLAVTKTRTQSEKEHMEFAKVFDRPWAANWTLKAKKYLGLS